MKRRSLLRGAGVALAAPWLAGCGGGGSGSNGSARMRLVNASVGHAALDLHVDDDVQADGVAFGGASDFIDTGTSVTVALSAAGSDSLLSSSERTFSSDTAYTVLAYGWAGALKTMQLTENTDAPDSGKARLRVLHAAPDAGSVDVYVTGASDTLDSATPWASALAPTAAGATQQIAGGSWRVRVTDSGNANDLRLDLPAVPLPAGEVLTLVLVSGTGGVLVGALMVAEGGAVSSWPNPAGRVRVVASVEGFAAVNAQAGGVTLLGGGVSPTVGGYVLVPAGTHALTLSVGGTAVTVDDLAVAAGGDTTLLVHGTVASPRLTVLADNHRLPTSSSQFKIRMVHAASPLAPAAAALTIDLAAVVDGLAYAGASAWVNLDAIDEADLAAATPLSITPVYAANDVKLAAKGVYTLFLLTAGSSVQGLLRKEV